MPLEDDLILLKPKDWKRAQAPLLNWINLMAQRLNSPDLSGALHFVTLNVRDRKRAFARAGYAEMVLCELRFECDRHPATLAAYVVMPDHLHFLIGPQDGKVSRFLARFKPGVTLKLDALATQNARFKEQEWLAEKGKRELWQDGKHSIPLYSPAWIREKIEYIHANPVRAGLVESPGEFLFSSFGAYFPESGHLPLAKVDLVDLF